MATGSLARALVSVCIGPTLPSAANATARTGSSLESRERVVLVWKTSTPRSRSVSATVGA
jgi:hypothetical protein